VPAGGILPRGTEEFLFLYNKNISTLLLMWPGPEWILATSNIFFRRAIYSTIMARNVMFVADLFSME
jgi:hypothetical protein